MPGCDEYVIGVRPNGLPISRRKRAKMTAKKPTISRAKRSAAWACSALWSPSFVCQKHLPTTQASYHTGTPGRNLNHAHLGARSAQRASI